MRGAAGDGSGDAGGGAAPGAASTASARAAASCCRPTTRFARCSRSAGRNNDRGLPVRRAARELGHRRPGGVDGRPRARLVAARRRPARLRHRGRAARRWRWACKSILVGDIGHLAVLGRMKKDGDLPPDFVLKISVTLAAANPAAGARAARTSARRRINLPGRPDAAADRRHPPGHRRRDRFLRREPGRFRRHRAPLRDRRARPRRRADLPEVRPAQLTRRSIRAASTWRARCWRSRASACAAPRSGWRSCAATRRRRSPPPKAHGSGLTAQVRASRAEPHDWEC